MARPVRMVLFDLDGTLLGEGNKRVSTANAAAIARLREVGVRVVVITGRPAASAWPIVEQIGPLDAVVVEGGCLVLGGDGQPWCNRAMATSLVRALAAAAEDEHGVSAYVPTASGQIYCESLTSPVSRRIAEDFGLGDALRCVSRLASFDFPREEVALRVHLEVAMADQPALHRLRERIAASALPCVVSANEPQSLDIVPEGADKAAAMRQVCERLGVDPGEALAFGDAENDVGMLRDAGVGVAMENAVASAKDQADIVIGHHGTDAIAEFLGNLGVDHRREGTLLYEARVR